jgi:hypothetical protein
LKIRLKVQFLKIGCGVRFRRVRRRCREQSPNFEVFGIVLIEGDDDVPDLVPRIVGTVAPSV